LKIRPDDGVWVDDVFEKVMNAVLQIVLVVVVVAVEHEVVREVSRAGHYAAFLGSTYNPTWTEYLGRSTRSVEKTLRDMKVDVHDPYVACDADSHFRFSATAPLPDWTASVRLVVTPKDSMSLVATFDDGVRLYNSRALAVAGGLANVVRERKNGNAAYFVRNMHLNPTNVCTVDCALCAFARKPS
jgi:hypothetical protein